MARLVQCWIPTELLRLARDGGWLFPSHSRASDGRGFVSLLNAFIIMCALCYMFSSTWLVTQDYYALVKICPAVLLMGRFYDVSVKSRQLLERILKEPDLERRNLLRHTALNRTVINIGLDMTGHAIWTHDMRKMLCIVTRTKVSRVSQTNCII